MPPAERIQPPSTPRERLLPLVDVGSRRFEELCQALVRPEFPDVIHAALKRSSGLPQYGVDIEGFDKDHHPAVVLSAKCYREIKAWDFRPWIDDFLKELDGHWKGKRVKVFVLAISVEGNDDDLNDAARTLVAELKTKGIEFRLWDAVWITELLANDATLVARFFNDYWVNAVVARRPQLEQAVTGATPISNDTPSASRLVWIEQIASDIEAPILRQLDQALTARLEEAVQRLREGRNGPIEVWLADARRDHCMWGRLDAPMRAKALRVSAMIRAQADDIEDAIRILDEADALAEPPDATARAFVARMQGDPDRAMAILRNRSTLREREFEVALLIEGGRAPEALEALNSLKGQDISTEVLRLRAIVAVINGDFDQALRDATSALERAPQDVAPLLTLATIRFFASLANGVRPQFGSMPQPIAPGLFKDTPQARAHLAQAIHDFDRLRQVVEGRLRIECEMWRFAALLLHPERREEAASVARAVLAREDIEPVAVCWALTFGLVRRPGRVKKALIDTIRAGRGTPTHLLAFALMSVDSGRPDQAVAAMIRHAHYFPEATNFLERWRAQFGDSMVPAVDGCADAIRRCVAVGSNADLLGFLAPSSTAVEDVLSGAEFLASRSAWTDLVELRSHLLKIGTSRTFYLAAIAALNSGDADGCLEILERAALAAPDGTLPRHLIYLRVKANEARGRHGPAITDLVAMRRQGFDPEVDGRLMEAYAQIGALPEFEKLATRALDERRLDTRQALQVAQLLRSAAPPTARRALEAAAATGVTPDVTGTALSLAAELGATELQDDLLRTLTAQKFGPGLKALSSVEELLAFLNERAQEYKERFAEWLSGHVPAAVAMNADPKTYVRLFLADPAERRNEVGDLFPMLLRSGAVRAPPPSVAGERPLLRIDLSALLLADRLEILVDVEARFALEVPRCLPEALRELEAAFRPADAGMLDEVDGALDTGRSALRFAEEAPSDAARLECDEKSAAAEGGTLAALLDRAFAEGHLTEEDRDAARRVLVTEESLTGDPSPSVTLSPFALYRLAAARVLQQVARATPLFLLPSDEDICRRDLRRWIYDRHMSGRLSQLRAMVADRLVLDRWTTIPQAALQGLDNSERTAPHVRCLLEIVAAQSSVPSLYWIEDRALSHLRYDGALDIIDVIDHLHGRNVVVASRQAACHRALRDFGYAFMPVEAEAILVEICAAKDDDFGLVETEELAACRRWFALEVGRLAHIDRHLRYGGDGAVISEPRRLIEIGGLARTLLAKIWTATGSTPARRRAESSWIWTSLSADQIPGASIEDPSAILSIVAALIAHTLDIPLLAGMGETRMMSEASRAFIDWFMTIKVEPFANGDPKAAGALADHLAGMIDRLLESSADLEPDQEVWLSRVFAFRARNFLELLPVTWQERILDRSDLRERLRMKRVVSFSIADGTQCTAAAVSAAYAQAIEAAQREDDDPVTVPLTLIDGAAAMLRLDVTGLIPSPIVGVGEREGRFDAATSALLDPNEERRVAALNRIDDLIVPSGSLRRPDLEKVARIADIDSRLEAFEGAMAADLDRRLRNTRDRVRSDGRLSSSDFDPPSVADMLRFLRSIDRQGEGAGRLDGLDVRLRSDLDLGEVARRLAGLPIEPSDQFLRSLGSWLEAGEGKTLAYDSPLLAFMLMRALVTTEAKETALLSGVEGIVRALRERGRLFAALVRYTTIETLDRDDWFALDPEMYVSLVWSFADSVTQIIAAPGTDLNELADAMQARATYGLPERKALAERPDWCRRLTIDLDADRVACAIVNMLLRQNILSRLPDEGVVVLREIVGIDTEAGFHPKIALIAVPPVAPERFWCVGDVVASMLEVGWVDPERWFAARTNGDMVGRLLGWEWTRENRFLLPVHLSDIDMRLIPQSELSRIRPLIEEIESEAAFEPNSGGVQRSLLTRAAVLSVLDEVEAMHGALTRQAFRCASRWSDQPVRSLSETTGAAIALGLIVEAAFNHAMRLPRPRAARFVVFAEALQAVTSCWPQSTRAAVETLDTVVRQTTVGTAKGLWPVLLSLRAV